MESLLGLTVAIFVLYDPNCIFVTLADPRPELTLAVMVLVAPTDKLADDGEVVTKQGAGVGLAVGTGVGDAVGLLTVTSVSVTPLDWQVLPSDKSAVAQTAVDPPLTAVTVVEYGLDESLLGLTVATPVLYDPNLICVTFALPIPEVTLAVTVPVPPVVKPRANGDVVTEHGAGVGLGLGVGTGVGVGEGDGAGVQVAGMVKF